MSEFMVPLLVSLLVPGCALALLLWLAHLEDTLDQAIQRRYAQKSAADRARSEQTPSAVPAPVGERSAP